jgi:hypothetical protein
MKTNRKDGRIAAYRTVTASSKAEAIAVATESILRGGWFTDPTDGLAQEGYRPNYWDVKVYVRPVPREKTETEEDS